MKCFYCEEEARAICMFCGKFLCKTHREELSKINALAMKTPYLGDQRKFLQQEVVNASWCGECNVKFYQKP